MIKIYTTAINTSLNKLQTLKAGLACLLFSLLVLGAQAQYGVNDPTFNPNDRGYFFGDGHSWYSSNFQILPLPGGKMMVLGSSTSYNGVYISGVQRINSDGSIDTGFHTSGTNTTVTSGAVQPDGKVVITGFFNSYNGTGVNHLARINVDGSLDTTFHIGTGLNIPGSAYNPGLVLQSDGKIIVEDLTITDYNGTTIPNMCRINTDGTIDSAYLLNLPPNPFTAKGIALQQNGKLLMAAGQRLNTDGTVDSTFNNGGNPNNGGAYAMVEQPDHKILIGGSFQTWNGVNTTDLFRIDSLGNLDNTFSLGQSNMNSCTAIALQPDGKIIAGGWFDTINGRLVNGVVRLNANGTTDNTFSAGTALDNIDQFQLAVNTINLLAGGQMILGGDWYTFNGTSRKAFVKLNANGSIEPTFNRMGSSNLDIYTTCIQTDGKLLFGGSFDAYQNVPAANIVRTDTNGVIDTSFNTHGAIGVSGNTGVWAISQQRDGKIVVGGSFNGVNNSTASRIARFKTNGTLDTSFNAGSGADNDVRALAIDTSGKILVGGYFTNFNNMPLPYLVRLNANGSVDTTFHTGTGTNGQVHVIKLQPNGKILVGGNFTTYNGSSTHGLMRLNNDGTVDTSFDIRNTAYTYAIELLPNGQIMAGGSFNYYDPATNRSYNHLVKFNANGTVDPAFLANGGTNGIVYSVKALSDGKYFVAGGFTSPQRNTAIFYPNGQVEHIYQHGHGADQDVDGAILQGNKILIYGAFSEFDSIGRNRVARLANFCNMPASPHGAVGATICANNTATISVAAGTGVLGWYSDSLSSNTYLGSGTSFTTRTLTETTTFYVQDSTCDKSFIRTPVTVIVKNAPRIHFSSNIDTVCPGSHEIVYVRSDSGATFHWATGATIDSIIVSPATSRYYSVTVTSINNCVNADSFFVNVYPGAPVAQVLEFPGTVNVATGGTPSASDSYGGNEPQYAFDGDTATTGWGNSGSGLPSWLAYDFGAGHAKVIGAYSFYNSAGMVGGWNSQSYNPVTYTFEGSNDSISWTVLDTVADAQLSIGHLKYYISSNTNAYRWYRFYFTYTVDGSYVRLSEVQLFAADTQACHNKTFLAVPLNFAADTFYQWKLNGVNIAQANGNMVTVPSLHSNDTVSCTIRGTTYCNAIGTVTGNYAVNNLPRTTVTIHGDSIIADAQNVSYQWAHCGANISLIQGQTGSSFKPDTSGNYVLIVTQGPCVDTSACIAYTKPTGLQNISADGINISIYPNPNNGTFIINSSVGGEYSLCNQLGQTVQNITLVSNTNYQLNNNKLASGIYYLVSTDAHYSVRNKIVVLK